MDTMVNGILIGAGGALLAALVTYLAGRTRRQAALPSEVEQLRRGVYAILQGESKQNACMEEILAVQQTMLEVIKDGKINGNIAKAIEKNEQAGAHVEEAKQIAADYMTAEAAGVAK